MNNGEILQNLLTQYNGDLPEAEAVARGVSRPTIGAYIKSNGMERAAVGIYMQSELLPDELFILQCKNKEAVF